MSRVCGYTTQGGAQEATRVPDMDRVPITEAEQQTGIPGRTIRRYLARHSEFIRSQEQGRARYIEAASLPVLEAIRDHYRAGLNADQVDVRLGDTTSRQLVVRPDQAVVDARQVDEMTDAMMLLVEEVRRLREQVDQLTNRRPWWRFWG